LGIVHLHQGQILIDGLDAQKFSVATRKRISYLPSDSNLYLSISGQSFLDFALSFYPNSNLSLLKELKEMFALPMDKKILTYSTGMKRKLLILQALGADTPILLLDEA